MAPTLRRFQAAVWALFYFSPDSTVLGFTASSVSTASVARHNLPYHPTTTLSAVHTAALSADDDTQQPQRSTRPTDEEQRDLLRQVVERRRLQNLQDQTKASTTTTSTLQLAQAAGYGHDLQAYQAALDDGCAAREALVTRNMGLVYYCVNEIVGKRTLQSLSREDLVQEGAIGLARAVDRWDPAIGGKFSTYAVYWVRAAILRGIAERDDLMRVPEHVSAVVHKVTRAAATLGLNIDGDNFLTAVYSSSKEASWKEAKAAKLLAEQAGVTPAQLAQALQVRKRRNKGVTSFETWMQKGQDLGSDTSVTADTVSDGTASKEVLRQELSRFLRPREMEALSWRYGLVTSSEAKPAARPQNYLARAEEEIFGSGGRWGEAMSFVEVGKRMHVSAEYGRRLCHAALAKLKQAAEDGNLSPSLLTL